MLEKQVEAVREAGARAWSDDVEAIAGILGAAGVLDRAVGARRSLARDLAKRSASASDVLTWVSFHLGRGRGPGWMLQALRANPEHVWLARSSGARELLAGPTNHVRLHQIELMLRRLVGQQKEIAQTVQPQAALGNLRRYG